MVKNWGKLAYPSFMENSDCVIFARGEEIWRGWCFFAWRDGRRQERDGLLQEISGFVTVGQDLQDVLCGFGCCIVIRTYLINVKKT